MYSASTCVHSSEDVREGRPANSGQQRHAGQLSCLADVCELVCKTDKLHCMLEEVGVIDAVLSSAIRSSVCIVCAYLCDSVLMCAHMSTCPIAVDALCVRSCLR